MVILYYEIHSFRIIDVHLTLNRAHRAHFVPTRNTRKKSWTF